MISWKREIKFAPVYATRPNSCILSISADRDDGSVEKDLSDIYTENCFRFAWKNLANIKDKVCASQYNTFSTIKIKDKN